MLTTHMYDQFLKELGLELRPSAGNLQVSSSLLTLIKGIELGGIKAYWHLVKAPHMSVGTKA